MAEQEHTSLANARNIAYAVLDNRGNLIPRLSHLPHSPQDTASTVKLWTLYTLLRMDRAGALPEGFLETHRADIRRMVIDSNNQATLRLAAAAVGQALTPERLELAGRVEPPPPPAVFMVRPFTDKMNAYATQQGLRDTTFLTVNGQPTDGHFSTPHDMARMMFLLQRDFGQHPVLQRLEAVRTGGTSAAIYRASTANGADDAVLFGKTGTGEGPVGFSGESHYVGQTANGFFALVGARDVETRLELVCELAASIPASSRPASVARAPAPSAPAGPAPPPAVTRSSTAPAMHDASLAAAMNAAMTPRQKGILDADGNGRVSIAEYGNFFRYQEGMAPLRKAFAEGAFTAREFSAAFQRQLDSKSNTQMDSIVDANPRIVASMRDTNADGLHNHQDIRAQISAANISRMQADGVIGRDELIEQLNLPKPTRSPTRQ